MINPNPTSHEDFLSRRYPKGDIPVNFKISHENEKDDTIESYNNDSGGSGMSNYVTRDEFKDEMRAMRSDMNNNFNSIRTDMNNNINNLRSEMNTNANNLRVEMQNSISKLPTNSDVKNMLFENNKELEKEAKTNRNAIIGWTIGLISLGFTIAKSLGWL
ncbi:hypothetical protein B7454_04765 [Staphylococcus lugdunensis]|uniref:hypothetical protein n=1 Tax=Staphylococcus lugdunensis TaxID=28035 RepID=UPI000DC70E96|nr:hypothetical protein [Staphylococcus lugdunensis]ARJ08733.1 hypothetical protein B7454_04765 [Staphylococcus lugdunensis]